MNARTRLEQGSSAVIVAISFTVMLAMAAIAIEYSKGVAFKIDEQAIIDTAVEQLAAECLDTSSGLDCASSSTMTARAQELIDLNSSEITVTDVTKTGNSITLEATSLQDAGMLGYLDSSLDTVEVAGSATAAWEMTADQIPISGPTTPFALDYCTWQKYNPESGTTDPGSVQAYNMLSNNHSSRANDATCTGVPGFSSSTKIAGRNHEMLWITYDRGDVLGTDKDNDCQLAFAPDGVSIARDLDYTFPNYAAVDDGWDDVRDRSCTGKALAQLQVGKVILMPIMAMEPSSASWKYNRTWELMQYGSYYAPTFKAVGYAPFEITGFLNASGNVTQGSCSVTTGYPIPYNPTCTGIVGKFVLSSSTFDGWTYGEATQGGVVDLGNTTGGNIKLSE